MDFYNNVFYQYVINARWFTRAIVLFIFGANLIMPVFIWFFLGGRKIKLTRLRRMAEDRISKLPK